MLVCCRQRPAECALFRSTGGMFQQRTLQLIQLGLRVEGARRLANSTCPKARRAAPWGWPCPADGVARHATRRLSLCRSQGGRKGQRLYEYVRGPQRGPCKAEFQPSSRTHAWLSLAPRPRRRNAKPQRDRLAALPRVPLRHGTAMITPALEAHSPLQCTLWEAKKEYMPLTDIMWKDFPHSPVALERVAA
jgi:hypothetical protein